MVWKSSGLVIQTLACHLSIHIVSLRYTQRVCGHVPSPVRVRESTTSSLFIFLICSPLPFLPKTPASWRGQENWGEGSRKCE